MIDLKPQLSIAIFKKRPTNTLLNIKYLSTIKQIKDVGSIKSFPKKA